MKKSEIVLNGLYCNNKGWVRCIVAIEDDDYVRYKIVIAPVRSQGRVASITRSSFAAWAKQRVGTYGKPPQ